MRVAESADFELDYNEDNLHHKYVDIEEYEEEEEDVAEVHDHHDGDTEEVIVLPEEWPRLLNFPEIKTQAALDALTTDPKLRQANHVFLYFVTSASLEAFEMIDEVNNSFQKAVSSYGIDSVIFYKIDGNEFADQFSVHTYPTIVYVEQQSDSKVALRRLVGPMITERGLDRFVMECVETASPAAEEQKIESGVSSKGEDAKGLDPEVLMEEVKAAEAYIDALKSALTDAYKENSNLHSHEHDHDHTLPSEYADYVYFYLEQDELTFQMLANQQEVLKT